MAGSISVSCAEQMPMRRASAVHSRGCDEVARSNDAVEGGPEDGSKKSEQNLR